MNFDEIIAIKYHDNTVGEFLLCAGILLFGFLFRKFVSKNISHFFFRFFKKFARNKFLMEFDELLKKPIQVFFELVFVYVAFYPIHLPHEWNLVLFKGMNVNGLITVVFDMFLIGSITWIVLRNVDFISLVLMDKASETEDTTDDQLVGFFKELSKFALVIVAVFIVLGIVFKLNIAAIVTGLGLGGLAIALAAQETLSNLLSSFIIFIDKPFKAGELISTNSITGTIEKVGFRSTRIRTLEKSLVTVPNKSLIDSPLNNITLSSFRRVKTIIGLLYGTKADQIRNVCQQIEKVLTDHELIDNDYTVRFSDFNSSSLDITVLYFVSTNSWDVMMEVKQGINYSIMDIVEANGCEFAFPTQTIHLQKSE